MSAIGTQMHDLINSGMKRWWLRVVKGRCGGKREESRELKTRFGLIVKNKLADAGGDGRTVLRNQILRRERGQGNTHFPFSPDHKQVWQPYPVDQ